MTARAAPSVITIVGGGFAGTALAAQLARRTDLAGVEVHLIEPRPVPGPGLAYTARRPEYLLNVRPGALSLYADQPRHFAEWLAAQPEARPTPPEFAARATYGRYLAGELAQALRQPIAGGPTLRWHPTAAVGATARADSEWQVQLADNSAVVSQFVVLALGNFPPPPPTGPDRRYLAHPGYHADAWTTGTLRCIEPTEPVLLIGSGLTAVDVLLALRQDGHQAPVTVVSRHGRWPAAHGPANAHYPSFYSDLQGQSSVSEVLRTVRRHVRQAQARGHDWRPVLDALRPDLGRIWAAWPPAEQARFLRHLAGRWAVVRHRSPAANAAAVADLSAAGLVRLHRGSVAEIVPNGADLRVRVGRGPRTNQWHTARHVVCCAGPLLNYARISDPLVECLRDAGHLTPDPLGLGLRTAENGALLSSNGTVVSGLFTLGASRRPAYFESTAVPEIREQAAALAAILGKKCGQNSAG